MSVARWLFLLSLYAGLTENTYGYEILCDVPSVITLVEQLNGRRYAVVNVEKLSGRKLVLVSPAMEIRFDPPPRTEEDVSKILNKALGPKFSTVVATNCGPISCDHYLKFGAADKPIVVSPEGDANSLLDLSTDTQTGLGPIAKERIVGLSSLSGQVWIWCALIQN
jgi:hypothetical protein